MTSTVPSLEARSGETPTLHERPVVAVLGARYPDLDVERNVLAAASPLLRQDPGTSTDAILMAARDAEVILCGSRPVLDASVIDELEACRGIVRYGIGVDNVDLSAAARRRIYVARVSDYGTEAVALHAVTLSLDLLRQIHQADRHVKQGRWNLAEFHDLHLPTNTTIGIVGLGRIGRTAAGLFLRLGFVVRGYDVADVQPGDDVEVVESLEELLETSDLVTLHVPGHLDGMPLLAAEHLRHMRKGSALVNTSRGGLVDVAALALALSRRRPEFAALDVFPTEPPHLDVFAPVRNQVLMTPHMAWYTQETEIRLRRGAAAEALRLLSGEPPLDIVVGEMNWA